MNIIAQKQDDGYEMYRRTIQEVNLLVLIIRKANANSYPKEILYIKTNKKNFFLNYFYYGINRLAQEVIREGFFFFVLFNHSVGKSLLVLLI